MVETNITSIAKNKIFALSDIHSDIHAFIICLRDCMKVIEKTKGTKYDKNILNLETENYLECDLNTTPHYPDDLNYQWVGGNTIIVICGDILDGYRNVISPLRESKIKNSRCYPNNCNQNEYDQVEIKLLLFINSINKQAMEVGGRIYKILGNHDVVNMIPNEKIYANYVNPFTKKLSKSYHNNLSRSEYFNIGNIGSELLLKDGAFIFLKINNNIFIHGQLDGMKQYSDYVNYNNILNDIDNVKKITILEDIFNKTKIFNRDYDRFNNEINMYGDESSKIQEQRQKCREVRNMIDVLINSIPNNTFKKEDMRIIIGHCPQYFYNVEIENTKIINSTFTDIKKTDDITETLYGNIKTDKANVLQNFVFGIAMECDKITLDGTNNDNMNERYIYKVDIGSSRAFDSNDFNNNYYESRVPQVLEIDNNNLQIIRSTLKNTSIHQPRQTYKEYLMLKQKNIDKKKAVKERQDKAYEKFIERHKKNYHYKYLKYKTKYLRLKLNI